MGHNVSRSKGSPGDGSLEEGNSSSSCRRFFKLRRNHCASDSVHDEDSKNKKFFTVGQFSGIARIKLIEAEMEFKDTWFVCVSLGEKTFKTVTSDQTYKPIWKSEKKVALEANGPRIARISVFETNRLSKSNLVGYCEIDLTDILILDDLYEPGFMSRPLCSRERMMNAGFADRSWETQNSSWTGQMLDATLKIW